MGVLLVLFLTAVGAITVIALGQVMLFGGGC
jgi:hypothetical protein